MDPLSPNPRAFDISTSRKRQLTIIVAVTLLALLAGLAIWQTTGTHGATRDVAAANAKVSDKQKEVEEATRVLDQKVAELRALRADADAQATKLGGTIDRQLQGATNGAQVDLPTDAAVTTAGGDVVEPQYYVRDRRGRFVPVTRP